MVYEPQMPALTPRCGDEKPKQRQSESLGAYREMPINCYQVLALTNNKQSSFDAFRLLQRHNLAK